MERRSREQVQSIASASAPRATSPCPMCEGRPRVITTPATGANRYRLAANKTRRANGAKRRVRGGSFRQSCGVCSGTGEVQFSLRDRELVQSFDLDDAREESTATATEAA